VLGVRGEQDRLDPVARGDVERALALAANGQVGESDRRAVHARHVVHVSFRCGRMIGSDQQLVVRDEPGGAMKCLPVVDKQSGSHESGAQLVGDELLDALACDGNAEQEEPEKHGQLVGIAEPSQVGRQLGRPREELVARREPLLDSARLVAREPQQPSELDGSFGALDPRGVRSRGQGDGAQYALCVFRSYLN
jgi:hypothetical protein